MTQEIDPHLDRSLREDMYLIGTFQSLDVMIEPAVMAILMRIPHLAVVKNHNHPRDLGARDQQIELAIGFHLTDRETLLHSNLHNRLRDKLIQITDD